MTRASTYARRLPKRTWYYLGGFSNPRLFRRQVRGSWRYFML